MTGKKHHDLGIRTLINGLGVLLIALFIFLAELPPVRWIFALAVAVIAAIAVWEYGQLVKKKGISPANTLSIIAVFLYVFSVFFKTQGPYTFIPSFWPYAPQMILALSFFACFVYFVIKNKPAITHISATFLGIIYIGIPLGLFVQIIFFFIYKGVDASHLHGSWWMIYLIAVTKSSDIGGYFIGRFFGKHKLALKLSPNKTLEGALGGLAASLVASVFLCFLGKKLGHSFDLFTYIQAIWLGIVIGIIGQLGDLAESLLKRDAGAKDSNSLPGVGGILDMIDSLLFTAPVLYIFMRMLYTR
jgi:phosphatidate cytidylyltransferase